MKSSLLLWVSLAIALAGPAAQAQPKTVTVYSDEFAGSSATLGIGKYHYMDLVKLGASSVRSVRVPEGLMITIYDKDEFAGNTLTLTDDGNKRLLSAKGFGDIMFNISIEVAALPEELAKAPFVTIYKDNYSGPSKKLRAGTYDFFELGNVDNDQLSSVKIPKGMKVILYEHKEMGGRSVELTADASASFLVSKKFNDVASSIVVEELPKPEPVVETPAPVKEPVKPAETVPAQENAEPEIAPGQAITLYVGNTSKRFPVGRFDANAIGNQRNLVSLRMPQGLRVVLYEQPAFKGKSLTIDEDGITRLYFEQKKFLTVGSLIVEALPSVTVFQDSYSGDSFAHYLPGFYNSGLIGIGNDELSSVKVGTGFWVLLFEHENFKGRSILLTKDASADFLSGRDFDNAASSMVIGTTDSPLPQVTLFQDNMTGKADKLTPGEYSMLSSNNSVSSVQVPRGMRVTLYDEPGLAGKSIILRAPVQADYLSSAGYDNMASSAVVELLQPRDYTVTIYADRFTGLGQDLLPGKYYARDLQVGDNAISSIHVPAGMRVTLYELDNFKGLIQIVDRDTDFTGSRFQDNVFSSLVVEDVLEPAFQGVITEITTPAQPVVVEQPVTETVLPPATTSTATDCEMTEKEFYTALKVMESKPFSEEKMTTALQATKDKCLSLEQIRRIAQQFSYEDQTLEFVKQAYDLCTEKSMYYSLDDIFRYMSSKDAFTKFLQSK